MTDYFDLGDHRRTVVTSSPLAQTWFDRGLVWCYGFNHEEAARCFQRAIDADPECAMAHWGLAYVVGPNYNKGWDAYDPVDLADSLAVARSASEAAALYATEPLEQELIATLAARYPRLDATPEDLVHGVQWCEQYAEAMREVYQRHPDDLDVIALFAESLLQVTPWQLWDLPTGRPAEGAHTVEAQELLERALARPQARNHPGILHMYIHLMEMSPTPERALWAADWIREAAPDAGHLVHMATHIDVLCGDYRRVITGNAKAVEADNRYVEREGKVNFYTLYRLHNLHFKIYGAMFLGQEQVALETSQELVEALPEELLRVEVPPMADWLEGFLSMRVHALIRFGRWDDLIDLPLPDDQQLYCSTVAMTHYGKGVAFSATGRVEEAAEQQRLFAAAVERVPDTRTVFNNTVQDILQVAAAMLEGELEYRKGDYDKAFAALRRSIELDDSLPYDEPWGWMQPTRHAYGALLMEQGEVELAEAVYQADLGLDNTLPRANQHPGNVWSLHGYHECLQRLGKDDEAKHVELQLRLATAQADLPIRASCACRMS